MRQLLMAVMLLITSPVWAEGKKIEAWVELDEAVKSQVDPDWQVFVYAINPKGKVPLASFTLEVNELPTTVVLTEGLYILPAYTMKSSDQFQVTAKISSTGKPHQTVKQDRIGRSKVISLKEGETAKVKVIIDRPALAH